MLPNFDLQSLVRDNVRDLIPYSSARDDFSGRANIFLDANENPLGSVGIVDKNRYPDPGCRELRALLSKELNLPSNQIFTGNGSDEIIDLLFRAFCRPGQDKAAVLTPSYGMYRVCAAVNDTEVIQINLDKNFEINISRTCDVITRTSNLKLLFICSPNNPTGNLLSKDKIIRIINQVKGIVVVDEAYIDFADSTGIFEELSNLPNLFILRTFSKAWGLAGIRLGIGLGSREIIRILNSIKLPYNVNNFTQKAAAKAILNTKKKDDYVREIIQQRNYLLKGLSGIKDITKIYATDANFILVKTCDAAGIYLALKQEGIIVRNRSALPGCENCLRITVGTARENNQLIQALQKL